MDRLQIAVLIPCRNEAAAIGKVVAQARESMPSAEIWVCDNDSTDDTRTIASQAGARVLSETQAGKGHAVRRLFADTEADIYVLVDGDGTYDLSRAGEMIDMMIHQKLDLVTGTRQAVSAASYRQGHKLGNRVLTGLVSLAFGRRATDMLSGYRVMSRRFVKSFPMLSGGFEIETELTVHAFELGMPQAELETEYRERAKGSASKLSTYRDGIRILRTILILVKEERPLAFFSGLAALLAGLSVALAVPVIQEFLRTGLVERLPTAVLSTGIMLVAVVCLGSGLILDTVTRGRREMKRLSYLRLPAVVEAASRPTGE
ncbi:glycosyltransferase [Lentisalinibacter sediminis]|uniref:glycosyltransferase n=1 Tax=Lentisalinibacter sediminis TaxID=2992237 RepID=UPI0038656930